VVDVVVVSVVAGRVQSLDVAAVEGDSAGAGPVDVAADDPVSPPSDRYAVAAVVADVADLAARDSAVRRVPDRDRGAVAALYCESLEGDVGDAPVEGEDRLHHRHADRHRCRVHALGWPEVEGPGGPVEVPLARRVELLTMALHEVPIARADGVAPVAGQRYGPLLAVHRIDADDVVPPVEAREHHHLALLRVRPLALIGWLVAEPVLGLMGHILVHGDVVAVDVGPAAGDGVGGVVVGVPRERGALAVAEKLPEARALEAQGLEVRSQHPALIGLPARDRSPADDGRLRAGGGAVDDVRARGARVLGVKGQRLRDLVQPGLHEHGDATLGQWALLLEGADRVAGAHEGLERQRLGARVQVAAVRRDMERHRGGGGQRGDRPRQYQSRDPGLSHPVTAPLQASSVRRSLPAGTGRWSASHDWTPAGQRARRRTGGGVRRLMPPPLGDRGAVGGGGRSSISRRDLPGRPL